MAENLLQRANSPMSPLTVPTESLANGSSRIAVLLNAQARLRRGYHTVFCGGGDGTFIGFADEILTEAEAARAAAPRFGVLKLGTGNGLASLVQASGERGGGVV